MKATITTRFVQSLTPQPKPCDVFDTALTGFLLRVEPTGRMTYYLAYRTAAGRRNRYRLGAVNSLTGNVADVHFTDLNLQTKFVSIDE